MLIIDILYEIYFCIRFMLIFTHDLLLNFSQLKINLKETLTFVLYKEFNFNNFRIVNSPVSKFINVENKLTNNYSVALNFGSYDYLGMTNSNINKSTLVDIYNIYNINTDIKLTEKLENKISFELRDSNFMFDTIVVNGGYQANSIFLPLILEDYNIIVSDKNNHSSIIKGISYSKTNNKQQQFIIFKSLDELSIILKNIRVSTNKIIVIVEGIYSMEGSILDLPYLITMKKLYNFDIYIDEAHSAGCIGNNLLGICDYYNIDSSKIEYLMGTFSKAFNGHGSYISGPKPIINILKTYRNNNNYNTLPAVTVQHILDVYNYIDENRLNLSNEYKKKIKYAYDSIRKNTSFNIISNNDSPVICLQFKFAYGMVNRISKYCINNNIAIVIVGYPVIKPPYAIIRLCISISHTYNDIDYLISCLNMTSDKSKLFSPNKLDIIDTDYINNNSVQDTIKKYSIGTSGPCGFFGYLSFAVIMEKMLETITSKNTSLVLPHSNSGYNDIFNTLVKRYKYKYICVQPNISHETLISIKLTQCIIIYNYDSKLSNVLYINFQPDTSKNIIDCLIIMNNDNINNINYNMYRFVIGSFNELCKGYGCFICYNEYKYKGFIIPIRTAYSSYLYSAALPGYIMHHNINNINKTLLLK